MSTTIDQRVVEMRFDNKHFEQNVSTTMSTLEKFKQKLRLDGAEKGLNNVNNAAKNVNMSGLGSAVETVRAKFSALEVMGVTALANITNSAVNAGKRMVKALTIDPVKTGFSEYETKINSIQTILSNTASKGTTMANVTRAIDELNTYADKTIYNFAEMTRNIGTFTAAGVGLEDSAAAIKGIANLAAASGSSSQQASTAMYQLSQALAAGTVKLMDWNSVVNAGMGGEKFQNALKETAREFGIGVDEIVESAGSFRESLSEGWISADVLNTTLNKFTVDGAKNYAAAMLKSGKYTQEQADALLKEAQAMEDAATKVKTFTQLWDTMKEAVQSGWGKTWELIIGDFEKARDRLTSLSDIFNGFIDKMSDKRNNLLESSLSSSYDIIIRKLNTVGIETDVFQNKIKELSGVSNEEWDNMVKDCGSFEKALQKLLKNEKFNKSVVSKAIKTLIGDVEEATETTGDMAAVMKKYGDVVNKVIRGDFGNGEERIRRLTEAGYDYATIQDLVNEKLGDTYRHGGKASKALNTLTDAQKKNADSLAKMSDEQLRSKGYTDEQIEALRFLQSEAGQAGRSIDDLVNSIDEMSGSELIWESLLNVIKAISQPLKIVGEAWHNIFGEVDADALRGVIEKIYELTSNMKMSEDQAKNFKMTMEGAFAGLQITSTVVWKTFSTGLKLLDSVLKLFGTDLFAAGAAIGEYIVQLRDWLNENTMFINSIDKVGTIIYTIIQGIHDCVVAFFGLEKVQGLIKSVSNAFSKFFDTVFGGLDGVGLNNIVDKINSIFANIQEWIKKLDTSESFGIGVNIIEGFVNGILSGVGDAVKAILNLGMSVIKSFCELLGIHSPSLVFAEFGKFIVQGLVNGIVFLINSAIDAITYLGNAIKDGWNRINFDSASDNFGNGFNKVIEYIKKIDFTSLIALVPVGLTVMISKNLLGIAEVLSEGIKSFNGVFNGIKGVFDNISLIEKAYAKKIKSESLKNMAFSVAILVGALVALTYAVKDIDDMSKVYEAVSIIVILSGVLVGLSWALDKMDKASVNISKGGASLSGLKTGLVAIGIAVLALAAAVKLMSGINLDDAKKGFIGLAGIITAVAGVMLVCGVAARIAGDGNTKAFGKAVLRLAVVMILLIGVTKLLRSLSPEDMVYGATFIGAFTAFLLLLGGAARLAGSSTNEFGKMAIKMVVAMSMLVFVCKLIRSLSVDDMLHGAKFAAGFVAFVGALAFATRAGGKDLPKIGALLFSVSASMVMLVGVCKLVGMLSVSDMAKGIAFMLAFSIMLSIMVKSLTVGNDKQIAKASGTILAMSTAIGILAMVSIVLGLLDIKSLAKGIAAVTILGGIMTAMIWATKGANDVKGNLITLAVAIGLLVGAIIGLTLVPDQSALIKASACLSMVMGMFALIIKASGKMGKVSASLLVMTGAVLALAGILILLSKLEVNSSIETAASLSLLMLALSGAMVILSKAGEVTNGAVLAAAKMSLVMLPLAAVLAALSALNVNGTIEIAASLSLLINALASACVILGMAKSGFESALPAVIMMSVIMMGLGAVLGLIESLGVGPSLETAASLSLLILSLSAACILLSAASAIAAAASVGIGAMVVVITAMGGLMAAIAGLVTWIPDLEGFLGKALPILKLIGQGIGEFLGGIITGVAKAALGILPMFGLALSGFMMGVQPFVTMASNIDSTVLSGVGYLSGAIIALSAANMISGISRFLSIGQSFAGMGLNLSMFAIAALPFFNIIKNVDPATIEAAKTVADIVMTLTKAEFVSGVSDLLSIFGGGSSFSEMGSQLKEFGEAAAEFSDSVKGKIDANAVEAAKNAGLAMVELSKSLPRKGGFLQDVVGEQDLALFGTTCVWFGTAIKQMSDALTGEDGSILINQDAISAAKTAGLAMSELASSLPKRDGFLQDVVGEQDLAKFGITCAWFGAAIKQMSDALTGEDGAVLINETAIDSAVTAGQKMNDLANAIPKQDGFLQDVVGAQDLGKFGLLCKSFGDCIMMMSKSLTGENGGSLLNVVAIDQAILAGSKMTELADAIPTDKMFDGKVSLSEFGEEIEKFGGSLTAFSGSLSEYDSSKVYNSLIDAEKMVSIATSVGEMDTDKIGNFNSIKSIGTAIKSYYSEISGIKIMDLSASVSTAVKLKDLINSLAGIDTSGVGSFKTAIEQLGSVSIKKIVSAFSASADELSKVGGNLMDSLVSGAKAKQVRVLQVVDDIIKSMVRMLTSQYDVFFKHGGALIGKLASGENAQRAKSISVIKSMLSLSSSAIRSYYGSFYSSGAYLGTGLVIGINSKQTAAYNAGYALGQKAVEGEKDGQQSHSPSKLTIQSGKWLGEGLIIGIKSLGSKVYGAGHNLGDTAATSIRSSITKIVDMIDSDMDVQPTIRPVVDLSGVRSGAGAINSMLGVGSSVGVLANVGAINTMMNRRIQNGGNSEVVSAIEKLRKDLGNVGGTSYNINGVTYDDGSNISEAVKTIVQAARVERRR